ncbi:peptidoglycan DD-metalloendopeptidase family protein [Fulvivirga lutea]|uniref:Peptidoglycan DD-metalloendopeptidase family protein n=1 Tax=Fulvivirga lutea TaxID=2810512 RepID=A0A974WHU0_9BACT|nr:peptidoglycan DD-metalloendopeptidase family protein [Fulvivirga lutea]QSE96365.1 peptidoglycan DD-metalloendopeptidase family protein [Fulvivirga lutea]
MTRIEAILSRNKDLFHPTTPFNFTKDPFFVFDFTKDNTALADVNLNDERSFNDYIFGSLAKENCKVGVGGYGENRTIYSRSDVFSDTENRSLHLGIDIWAPAGTPVYAPADAIVHSFKDNHQHGDYGPTIILEHELEGVKFHTLYGHLSRSSIEDLTIGAEIKKGTEFAWFGDYEENVHWPPHLHFQVIEDMGDKFGDFPGVCKPSEKAMWLKNCPNPNLILNIPGI